MLSFGTPGGAGQASVAATLNYVPAELPTSPAFRGIQLMLSVRATSAVNATAIGPPLTYAPLATVLRISLQFMTPDVLSTTLVRALLAGGLEPVDSNLDASGARVPCPLPWYFDGLSFGSSWRPFCPRIDTTPANVTFTLERVQPGTQEVSFLAIAASPGAPVCYSPVLQHCGLVQLLVHMPSCVAWPALQPGNSLQRSSIKAMRYSCAGTYTFPPAIAFVQDQPEVSGLSAALRFTVCAASTCTPAEVEAAEASRLSIPGSQPQGCPASCSGAGTCVSDTGTCQCDQGFKGADCSMFVGS